MKTAIIGPNGVIVYTVNVPDYTHAAMQGGEALSVLCPPDVTDKTHYYDGKGFVKYPPKPDPRLQWDGSKWVDTRTLADIINEEIEIRDRTYLSKSEFIHNCLACNILSEEEAVTSATQVPASFEPMIAKLPHYEQLSCRIKWPTIQRVGRHDPLFIMIADAAGVSEETRDAIFGLTEFKP